MAHGPGREHPDQLGHVESEELHEGEGRGVVEDHDVDLVAGLGQHPGVVVRGAWAVSRKTPIYFI